MDNLMLTPSTVIPHALPVVIPHTVAESILPKKRSCISVQARVQDDGLKKKHMCVNTYVQDDGLKITNTNAEG